jgi:hypothetical protein
VPKKACSKYYQSSPEQEEGEGWSQRVRGMDSRSNLQNRRQADRESEAGGREGKGGMAIPQQFGR